MAGKDPFAEGNEGERTVIRPNPGGRRTLPAAPVAPPPPVASPLAPPARDTAPPPAPRAPEDLIEAGMTGMNPLNAAAATLFALVSRVRNRAQHPDPDALRKAVITEIRAFESRALQAGIDAQQVKVARYAICATLDDVVLNTPWGETSVWAQQSMVGTFHRETVGGDRFYDLLARLEQDPGRNIDLLEFLFMCLALGFEGRLRVEQGGPDRHLTIRQGLARIIRAQRGEAERTLSPHWPGLDRPHRALSVWKPFWISLAAVAVLLGTGFVGLSFALSGGTERLLGSIAALDPADAPRLERRAPPVVQAPPVEEQGLLQRVEAFLQAEIDEGLVSVFQDANTVTVRMKGGGMFGSGSDVLKPQFKLPLERVAAALNDTTGPVLVVGHSDSQPIRSARFPSNMHLSLARAESVLRNLRDHVADPARLTAEGRADKEPLDRDKPTDAVNRRIEIVLIREQTR